MIRSHQWRLAKGRIASLNISKVMFFPEGTRGFQYTGPLVYVYGIVIYHDISML